MNDETRITELPLHTIADIAERKKQIREQAHANRNAQPNKDELSRVICDRFMALPAYAAAKTVMFYIDVRAEARTRHSLPAALASGKTIVVPWCNDRGALETLRRASRNDRAVATSKILEPKAGLPGWQEQRCRTEGVDLVMVRGGAFDRRGPRMGPGEGYYDKLLQDARPDAPLVALAF